MERREERRIIVVDICLVAESPAIENVEEVVPSEPVEPEVPLESVADAEVPASSEEESGEDHEEPAEATAHEGEPHNFPFSFGSTPCPSSK